MKILVVEDDIKIQKALKRGLEQESYSVDAVGTGTEGYDLASTEEYDLIILDLMLPEIDGITISKKLRETGRMMPILMLTARDTLDDKIKGFAVGTDDYLTKPFSFEELLARVRALLRRPAVTLPVILTCESLTMDTSNHKVTRGKTEINLSKKEYALLEFLLHNKNATLSKEKIINHVWNYESDVLENTVEQYIGYLRTKIDKNFPKEKPIIKTVRGFGYKIEEN